jgi:hypothetical protein
VLQGGKRVSGEPLGSHMWATSHFLHGDTAANSIGASQAMEHGCDWVRAYPGYRQQRP